MDWQAPGELLILFAFTANLVAGIAFSFVARGNYSFEPLARRSYHLFVASTTLAVVWLYVLFFTHNYAFKYIYEYSQKGQPFFYIVSAFWGGQEGTYLLWLFFNALFGYLILKFAAQYRNWGMAAFAVVNLFFLFLLVRLSPFAYLPQPAVDGIGLNPLLRDPWMVIHPPVMFVGYSMAALPFVIAIAALIKNDFAHWVKIAFPWVAVTALALGAGNILGGFWAYKTLGWGGYWGWDPVENSSLVPWIISLALLHGMIIERRSSALRKSNLLLASFLFLLVIYGTFLTRSGVLSDFSVHSFADLGINGLLVGFLLFFIAATAIIFGARFKQISSSPINYNFYSREFLLFIGLVTLLIFGLVVLFWMSLPILSSAFSDTPRAADISTYNSFAQPLAVLIAILLAISPFSNFVGADIARWKQKVSVLVGIAIMTAIVLALFVETEAEVTGITAGIAVLAFGVALLRGDWIRALIPGLICGGVTLGITIMAGVSQPLHMMFFSFATVALAVNAQVMIGYLPARWRIAGGHLTHLGFAFMIIGILASSGFSTSEKIVLPKGQTKPAAGFSVGYEGLAGKIDQANNEVLLSIVHDSDTIQGRPQLYYSERMGGYMKKPFISRSILYDVYFSPEDIKPPTSDPIVLDRGEMMTIGSAQFTFTGFDMGQHTGTDNIMKVIANIEVISNGSSKLITPARAHKTGPDGKPVSDDQRAEITIDGKAYQVSIAAIIADQGAVSINIPGFTDSDSPERLILDVSTKPLINLVWAGSILVLLGTALSFWRRCIESRLSETDLPVDTTVTTIPVIG